MAKCYNSIIHLLKKFPLINFTVKTNSRTHQQNPNGNVVTPPGPGSVVPRQQADCSSSPPISQAFLLMKFQECSGLLHVGTTDSVNQSSNEFSSALNLRVPHSLIPVALRTAGMGENAGTCFITYFTSLLCCLQKLKSQEMEEAVA